MVSCQNPKSIHDPLLKSPFLLLNLQDGAPVSCCVQLVYKWLNSMVYGRHNGDYFMVYKPTYNWAPSCTINQCQPSESFHLPFRGGTVTAVTVRLFCQEGPPPAPVEDRCPPKCHLVIQLTNKGNKGLGMVGKAYYYTFFTYCTSIGLLFDSLTKEKKWKIILPGYGGFLKWGYPGIVCFWCSMKSWWTSLWQKIWTMGEKQLILVIVGEHTLWLFFT